MMYSSVSLKRSDAGLAKKGGSNRVRGVITAILIDVSLASFVLSYFYYPLFHHLFALPPHLSTVWKL